MKGRIVDYDYYSNRAVMEFEPSFADTYDKYYGKDVNVDIKLWRPKRSGAANRYMWVLVDRIAKNQHLTKNEVYRKEITEIGGVSDVLLMADEAVERFCKQWEANGLGWQTEVILLGDGRSNVIAYYGSSTFDRDQMTQLIENLIFEAEQLGIDTDTPDKQLGWASLMEEAK
ncbi:MAG: hypothetical protein IJ594_03490 [Oscillospiraceae bacterium]|nr:hypothetical protein [Oscillospiraceae bacterium]